MYIQQVNVYLWLHSMGSEYKMFVDWKPARGRTRILTDSARKRNKKEISENYNKTRINIGHQHDRWMELKEALRVQTPVEA
jgi:hypothetical protein